jgi:hypothetical protein
MQMENANATLCAAYINTHSIDIQSEHRAYYIGGTFLLERAAEHVNANAHISKCHSIICAASDLSFCTIFCSSGAKSAACTLQKCHVRPPCRARRGKISNAKHNDGSMKCKTLASHSHTALQISHIDSQPTHILANWKNEVRTALSYCE